VFEFHREDDLLLASSQQNYVPEIQIQMPYGRVAVTGISVGSGFCVSLGLCIGLDFVVVLCGGVGFFASLGAGVDAPVWLVVVGSAHLAMVFWWWR